MKNIKICVINPHKELTIDGYLFKHSQATIGHNLLKPWCDFYQKAKPRHIDLVTLDQVNDIRSVDGLIFMDRPLAWDEESNALLNLPVVKYLVTYECAVVRADNWELDFHRKFDRIFTWSDEHVDGKKYLKFNFSMDPFPLEDTVVDEKIYAQRKLLTLIAGAKSSQHPNELYSHRLSAIRWYEQTHIDDFDLYGTGWNGSQFPSYRGTVLNKHETLQRYNFSICYENGAGYSGHVTEKLLDCLAAQNVAIYGGDPSIRTNIPQKCYIDVRDFSTFPDLHSYISAMPSSEYLDYLGEAQRFYSSEAGQKFSTSEVVENFIRTLEMDFAALIGSTGSTEAGVGFAAKGRLVVCVPYGEEQAVFLRAKSIWDFYSSFYDGFDLFFVRSDASKECGEVSLEGSNIIVVGIKNIQIPDNDDTNRYDQSGVWGKSENYLTIYRQVCMYDFLLRRYPENFHLFLPTVTSVIDFDGLKSAINCLPTERCFAGMPNTLDAPRYTQAPLKGLNIVFGTNTVLSRDTIKLARSRYRFDDVMILEPNDVWLSSVLQDVPRQALPFFSFTKYEPVGQLSNVLEIAESQNKKGHFQFRVKTDPSLYPLGVKREDVDPWIMLNVAKTILKTKGIRDYCGYLEFFQSSFEGGSENQIPARSTKHVFNGNNLIDWDDRNIQ